MLTQPEPAFGPNDCIDHAQAMIRFLALMLGESRGQMELPEREREGLCHILFHIEAKLNQALTGI